MTTKDLDDKLLEIFKDCPYKGKREDCTFPEMQKMEIDDRLDFLDKMDEEEKVTRWQKHLECLMNALAKWVINNIKTYDLTEWIIKPI